MTQQPNNLKTINMARILLLCLLAACNPVTKTSQEFVSGELRDL